MFVLPKLPYAFDALEPYIDARTMEIHYTKHNQGYVNNLNTALENHPIFQKKTLVELLTSLKDLPDDIRTAVRNNAGGSYNHALFWDWMTPHSSQQPKGKSAQAITHHFGSFEQCKKLFSQAAKGVFGSGWAWLSLNPEGALLIEQTPNQDCPISHKHKPILGLDVWEHAYYLKYQNKRPDYIEAWWHVVNWDYVEDRYLDALKSL